MAAHGGSGVKPLPASVLELAQSYIETCFPANANGRLEVRDAGLQSVPHFVMARTRLGCLWRFREDLDRGPVCDLARLAGREGPLAVAAEDSPLPERTQPMLRVLRDAGIEVEVERELLIRRVGWAANAEPNSTVALRIDAAHDEASLARAADDAQVAAVTWKLRRKLDASQWVCFSDFIQFAVSAGS